MSDGGVVFAMGPCIGCGGLFTFHPHLVPSVTIKNMREPICRVCVERVNPQRIANGLPPITILPGAYDAAPIGEL